MVQSLNESFQRFYGFLIAQIDLCTDELWEKKGGGYPFWQQMYHALGVMEVFANTDSEKSYQVLPPEVLFLSGTAEKALTRAEMKEFAVNIKKLCDDFIARQTSDTIVYLHPTLTERTKKDKTNFDAMLSMVSHGAYHVGCLDSVLRDNNIKGAY